MIPRYEDKSISNIWEEKQKFSYFLQAELAILSTFEGTLIPEGYSKEIENKVTINPQRIMEIEETTKHDVIAFCSSITEQLPPELGKYFHFGVTSSDIIDTALGLQIKDSLKIQLEHLKSVLETLKDISERDINIPILGRSHGMFAEPLALGQKWLSFYCEFYRRYKDLQQSFQEDCTGQFSGAVGNYTLLTRDQEKKALEKLNLKRESLSTQIVPRDRIAKIVSLNGLLAAGIERLAVEIRGLHRSEVAEIYEGFSKGQKGSSIMPHKKNPISGENLTGISRILKSHVSIALENCVLWHERDISHSSAERIFLPDHFGLMVYSLKRLKNTLENLIINKETIDNRVNKETQYYSSYYLHYLLKETKLTREEIYPIVQKAAFNKEKSFHENIISLVPELKNVKGPNVRDLFLKEARSQMKDIFSEFKI